MQRAAHSATVPSMVLAARPANVPLTYDEYVLFPEDGRRHEIMQGDHYVSPAPSPFHQTVSRRLLFALMQTLELTGIAWVFNAPIDLILSRTDVVQPDLVLLRRERRSLVTARGIEGPPDVVVEILSPHGTDRDERLKHALYARFAIPEYWIVDPDLGRVTLHRLGEAGYTIHAVFDRASTLASPAFPELAIALVGVFSEF